MENVRYAGFWARFIAVLIDVVVLFFVVQLPLTLIYGMNYWMSDKVVQGFWDIFLGYIVPFVATVWFWRRYLGTPGKMLLKLHIVDATTGQKMGTAQSVGRYFAYLVSILPLFLGFVWVAFDKRKQGWHDKLAGTVVVYHTAPTQESPSPRE